MRNGSVPAGAAGELPIQVPVRLIVADPCDTVTVCPAMVTVPLRVVPPVFALAVTVTLPEPEPLVGLTVRKPVLLAAVHVAGLQPLGLAVTLIETLPPLFATGPADVGDTANEQARPCVTVTDWLAIVTVAERVTVDGLAVTVSVTVP